MVFPLLAAATLGAGALSATSGNSAAKKAAKASQYATDQDIGLRREQYNQTRADLSPYMQAGQTGLGTLQSVAGQPMPNAYTAPDAFSYTAGDYQESPGLKFAIDRGIDAINSNMAKKGAMYSGAANKKIGSFVADTMLKDFQGERAFAQNAYTDQRNFGRAGYLDDRNFQYGAASDLAGIGQSSAAGVGNAGMAYANGAGNAYQSNAANQANAYGVASSNFNSLLGQGVNTYAQYAMRPGVVTPAAANSVIAANPYLF